MRSVLTCTSKLQTHLRWSGSRGWQLWIYRNSPQGSLCLGVPFQKTLQSFPLTFHSLYWARFVFIAPFAFPATLSVTCVEYGFCRLAKPFCCLAEGSLAGEFSSPHSNGHVCLMGPLSRASCIFRAAPLSPAWPRQQISEGIVNIPCSHWHAAETRICFPG